VNASWADDATLVVAADDCSVILTSGEHSRVLLRGRTGCSTNNVAVSDRAHVVGLSGTSSAILADTDRGSVQQIIQGTTLALAVQERSLSIIARDRVAIFARNNGAYKYEVVTAIKVPLLRSGAFDPSGATGAAFSADGTLRSWDFASSIHPKCTLPEAESTHYIAAYGAEVYFVTRRSGQSHLFKVDSACAKTSIMQTESEISAIAASYRILAISTRQGQLLFINSQTGKLLRHYSLQVSANALAFSPSAEKLAAVLSDDTVEIWSRPK
jgi:WD40 repeat protein